MLPWRTEAATCDWGRGKCQAEHQTLYIHHFTSSSQNPGRCVLLPFYLASVKTGLEEVGCAVSKKGQLVFHAGPLVPTVTALTGGAMEMPAHG